LGYYIRPKMQLNLTGRSFFMQLSMYYAAGAAVEESHRKND